MPTGSDRSTSPSHDEASIDAITDNNHHTDNGATANGENGQSCGGKSMSSATMSYDPTPYVQRARVTRPAPPKPSCNPMQFVQIKPCNLFKSAQEQLKRAEEVKKVKEIKKEEPEDWQCNLDNWKSSRRKRVEHIIDRVVEVKKLELEEHDRTRRKSKTFSEMLEERGDRPGGRKKLASLAVYQEDEANDLSDLGIGTSSASGKSSLSEDYDNHSVMSDNVDTEKASFDIDNNSNHENSSNGGGTRDYISSPGYDTSSSTAPASSPDPCEYTYEGAIQDYKTRVSRATSGGIGAGGYNNGFRSAVSPYSKDSTPERTVVDREPSSYQPRRGSKIEDRLMSFEVKSASDANENSIVKKDLPKVDILKRRELFEKETSLDNKSQKRRSGDFTAASVSIRDRLSNLEKKSDETKKSNRLSGDITSIKDRLQSLEKRESISSSIAATTVIEKPSAKIASVQVPSLKDRLSSLQSAVTKEEVKKPVVLVDERQLEIMKSEDQRLKRDTTYDDEQLHSSQEVLNIQEESSNTDTDREDSGIHTTDVSCSVSQTDEQAELVNIEGHHHINEDGLHESQEVAPEETTVAAAEEVAYSPEPPADLESSVNEALELALQAIDEETNKPPTEEVKTETDDPQIEQPEGKEQIESEEVPPVQSSEPIYEIIGDGEQTPLAASSPQFAASIVGSTAKIIVEPTVEKVMEESHYQVPKSSEPYYEVPKSRPVPVYENIEIFYNGSADLSPPQGIMEPPKEKPPPPPIDDATADDGELDETYETVSQKSSSINGTPMKRMNSTKRIKKEIRNKRSSFLGIEGSMEDESFLELTVAPPPDMAQLLQEEKRLEKQLYMKAGLYDSSDTGESRDSGVSENHSRQSSEPFTNSSEEPDRHEDLLSKKEKEIIEVLEKEEEKQKKSNWNGSASVVDDPESKILCIEEQIREQEEVLRVERELLQLEQEELKRQRENLILRENLARRELEHGAKMLMSANRRSLQDINASTNVYANIPNQIYQIDTDYRKSMSDLHDFSPKRVPPTPPAKPMRSQISYDGRQMAPMTNYNGGGLVKIATNHPRMQHSVSTDEFVPLRNYQLTSALHHGNMTRNTLLALSATPKPKYTDGWVQQKKLPEKSTDSWLTYQQKRKSVPEGFNYNKHWLIQEAEQRRIEQQRNSMNGWTNGGGSTNGSYSAIQRNGCTDNKPLPDAIIQTLTQRVQSKGIGERKRLEARSSESLTMPPNQLHASNGTLNGGGGISQPLSPINSATQENGQQDKILSVSGKKKCSHCGEELGRGAAMIIESLRLFYHINCFKCCVCHVQLGDGLNGTDVRVRNHKLHCQNCYSSDDGIKFSCV